MVTSRTTSWKVSEKSIGSMANSMRVIGKITKWKEKAFSSGQMVEYMKVIILTIKNMDLDVFGGQMVESTKDSGREGSNMEKGNTKAETAFGKKADGSTVSV